MPAEGTVVSLATLVIMGSKMVFAWGMQLLEACLSGQQILRWEKSHTSAVPVEASER